MLARKGESFSKPDIFEVVLQNPKSLLQYQRTILIKILSPWSFYFGPLFNEGKLANQRVYKTSNSLGLRSLQSCSKLLIKKLEFKIKTLSY